MRRSREKREGAGSPGTLWMRDRVGTSHSSTARSGEAVTSWRPSGEKAAQRMGTLWPCSTPWVEWRVGREGCMVRGQGARQRSQGAPASTKGCLLPELRGGNAQWAPWAAWRANGEPLCTWNVPRSRSHSRASQFSPHVASTRPAADPAMQYTRPWRGRGGGGGGWAGGGLCCACAHDPRSASSRGVGTRPGAWHSKHTKLSLQAAPGPPHGTRVAAPGAPQSPRPALTHPPTR